MKRFVLWVPLFLFVAFVAAVSVRLANPSDPTHPSRLIGQALPDFVLSQGASKRPALSRADFTGKPRLLNIFASWCIPCAAEAPVLETLAAKGVIIEGIAIRDKRQNLDAFLAKHGNPYRAIGMDPTSSVQIALGSSGVPETFVIDSQGVIIHQHIGDIRADDVDDILKILQDAK